MFLFQAHTLSHSWTLRADRAFLILGNPSLVLKSPPGVPPSMLQPRQHHSRHTLIQPLVALLLSPGRNEPRSSAWQSSRLTIQPQPPTYSFLYAECTMRHALATKTLQRSFLILTKIFTKARLFEPSKWSCYVSLVVCVHETSPCLYEVCHVQGFADVCCEHPRCQSVLCAVGTADHTIRVTAKRIRYQ